MEYLIVFLPLFSAFISGFFGTKIGDKNTQILSSILITISGILSSKYIRVPNHSK